MIQGMAGDLDKALATAGSIPDAAWRRWGLAMVVQSRAQAGDIPEALDLARGFREADDRRMALEHLAEGLSGGSSWNRRSGGRNPSIVGLEASSPWGELGAGLITLNCPFRLYRFHHPSVGNERRMKPWSRRVGAETGVGVVFQRITTWAIASWRA